MSEVATFPQSVYSTVVWRVAAIYADGPDIDSHPDWVPAVGEQITLSPSIKGQLMVYDAGSSKPWTVTVESVTAVINASGEMMMPDGSPVRIISPQDPRLSTTGWTWTATLKGKSVNFTANPGSVIDLSTFVFAPASDTTRDFMTQIPELVTIVTGGDDGLFLPGFIPMFETKEQALAWEIAHPGRRAVTIENPTTT